MSTRRRITIGVLLGTLCAAAIPACSKESKEEAPTEGPGSVALNEEQQLALKVLTTTLKADRWSFPADEVAKETNQPLFVHLASTSDRPALVGASFSALHKTYRKDGGEPLDLAAVDAVKKHLSTDNSRLLGRALELASTAIGRKTSDPALAQQLTELAQKQSSSAGRFAFLETLGKLPQDRRNEAITAYVVESLQAKEPYVVSLALHLIARARRSIKDEASLFAKVQPLLTHSDAGVRGRALSLLVVLNQAEPSLPSSAVAALSDDAPYVRAEACHALARMHHESAIHTVVALVEDKSEALYTIEGVPTLEGGTRRLNHRVNHAETVQQAAMTAVDDLAGKALTLPYLPKGPTREAAIAASAKQARDWYLANREQLSKPEPAKDQ